MLRRSTAAVTLAPLALALTLSLWAAGPGPAQAQAQTRAQAQTQAPAAGAEVPTFQEVTGHDFGERITLHHQMVRYLRALAEASDRVEVVDQGRSWEGRELPMAIVTSPENHARLEEIRSASARLADPRDLTEEEARALAAEQPAVVWMGGSIHGFELSGSEGVLTLLQRLATGDDPATREVLASTVVLLDPMINPDGRDAFAHRNHERLGHAPNARTEDWANDFDSWDALQFRTGHYFFDTNRDWFVHTQAETRSRVPTLLAWKPQVMVDLHEMGSDAEFYFDPPARPYGPFFPSFAREWFPRFGRAYARAFDRAGFEYMTGERYNYFYPGYTSSFGSFQGAVSMLFEQGSSRGLALDRPDGSIRTLADATEQQATAAWATVVTAAESREELLLDFHRAHREALEDGRSGVRRYLVVPDAADPALARELAALLLRNGIEVGRLTGEVRLRGVEDRTGTGVGERTFPPGTLVVEASQPRNRLVRALLAPEVPLAPDFLEEARARVDRAESPRFYDVTAWSLPLLFDLEAYGATAGDSPPTEPVTAEELDRPAPFPDAVPGYAYLVDGANAASMAVLHGLREDGIRASVLTVSTAIEGEPVPAGTVVVRSGQRGAEPERLHETVRTLAAEHGVAVRGVDTGLAEPGMPALGTGDAIAVRPVDVAILAEGPVHAYSFGWAWYTLDRQYRLPVTVLRVGSVAETPLAPFETIVVPDLFSAEGLTGALGEEGVARLRRWVEDGGNLVALGAGVDFVRDGLDLTGLRSWYREQAGPGSEEMEEPPPEPVRFRVPGAILRAELDLQRWLAAGAADAELPVLVDSDRILLAPEGPPDASRRVVARYAPGSGGVEDGAGGKAFLLSGHAWPESLERLPGAVFAYEERVGGGRIVAFAEDVNFRAFWRGANRLFLNAVVLGPSAP
ncbi:MAG: M14 family metallopeptidase [Acidobacteriota bacterium]